MKNKLIAIDLDGTLLRKDESLGELSKNVLQKLIQKGHAVVLISGRPTRSLLPIYNRIGCNAPLVSYNGAYIYSPFDPSFPNKEFSIPSKIPLEILKKGKDIFISSILDDSNYLYASKEDRYLKRYFPYEGIITKFGKIDSFPTEGVFSAVFKTHKKDREKLNELTSNLGNIKLRHWRNRFYSELYIENVNKGNAIEYIASIYNIDKEDRIAFGDSFNDLSMLEVCGTSFAMKNAKSKTLLDRFPITKKGNDQEGVALTLIDLFNL